MTQMTMLSKGIILYVCIGLVFTAFGYNVANNPADVFVTTNTTTGEYTYTQQVKDAIPNSGTMSRSTGLWSFIDTMASALSFISLLTINVIFFPLSFMTSIELPQIVVLFLGVPLFLIMILGLVYFVRSGQ